MPGPQIRRLSLIISLPTAIVLIIAIFTAPSSAQPSPAAPTIAGCPMLPADNIWNTRVDTLPVHARSDAYIASIGASTGIRTDFGAAIFEGAPIGIPYVTV